MTEPTEAIFDRTKLEDSRPALDDLLAALRRVDRLLKKAMVVARAAYGSKSDADAYRGLYVDEETVERSLAREPGTPPFQVQGEGAEESLPSLGDESSRLAWLQQAFGLSDFDLDLILIALAPELDLRYEQVYAYLQDDVTRKRPSVDLALNLLCSSAAEKLARRERFSPNAPLIRHGLLHLIPAPEREEPAELAYFLKLDNQILSLLLAREGLDRRLALFCQLVEPTAYLDELPLNPETKENLAALVVQAAEGQQPLKFYFYGPQGAGKRRTAEALASEVGMLLLAADLAQALRVKADFEQVLKLLFREAWFQDAVLYLEGIDVLHGDEQGIAYQKLLGALAENAGITILAGVQPKLPTGRRSVEAIAVPLPLPDFIQRRSCWQVNLAVAGIALSETDLDALASRFCLMPSQIEEAVTMACNQAIWRTASQSRDGFGVQLSISDLFAAARAQSGQDLATLARKIEAKYNWNDIVLPEDSLAQLREICQRVAHRHRVLGEWGFDEKLSLGKGVNALFAGPSGTGKTMAAGIIANQLGLDLYKIDLSGVVSKYIGETEKNLNRIFQAAENANAILFFDEADALFGKRSEVRDSHDRYANIEISYLLQKMEEYEGVSILTTNLRQNLDEAFVRRLAFTIHFPFPEEASRRQIWAGIWPSKMPLAEDVDLDFLARQFKLSGGNIKNVALAAAFLAAEEGDSVKMVHLLQAIRREYQKLGKTLSEGELKGTQEDRHLLMGD